MSFDLLAPHYRWLELVLAGDKLQRCRTAFIDALGDSQNVLILGEGNGRFLTTLSSRRANPLQITCLDSSAGMLARARARATRVRAEDTGLAFIHADALEWQPPERKFDTIVTHFFLDCFRADQLAELIPKLAGAATASATWLLADFQIPARGWRRARARAIHGIMYAFFRITTGLAARCLTPPDPFLQQTGFSLRERRVSDWGLLHSDLWRRSDAR